MADGAPILFLVFNRPETTARVFEAIRAARPARLYVAADGPRKSRKGEDARCAQTREIATAVDWPCELKTLFRDDNLGCRNAISSAISWFFEHEPEGVILEDDCLPDASFFSYCAELLERYRDDERVMVISGDGSAPFEFASDNSYLFSSFPLIWGWATWRRAWRHYDFEAFRKGPWSDVIASVSENAAFRERRETLCRATAEGEIDTWDYVWSFTVWSQSGLSVIPRSNLISNIGFGADATHTTESVNPRAALPTVPIRTPLTHPSRMFANAAFDASVIRHVHGIGPPRTLRTRLEKKWRKLTGSTAKAAH